MKLNVLYRNGVLAPCYNEDYEKAKSLPQNTPLSASFQTYRNPDFNRKYHALINRAWEVMNEQQTSFFGARGKEAFRKSMQVTAGFYDPVYNFSTKQWQQVPRSTSFENMEEDEFNELYNGVYDAIRALFTNSSMTEDEFDAVFCDF